MKKMFLGIILVLGLLILPACQQQEGQIEVMQLQEEVESPSTEALPTPITPEATIEEVAEPDEFVPIAVEDFGITTVVPADWPPIEDDPLLKNAWGPGEFRFVAFHTIPGMDARQAMAQLLGIELEELLQNQPEGEFWEEQIGSYDWALYNVDNPDIGLSQSVAMTIQDETVYIVSLFVEIENRDAILNAVLENFAIDRSTGESESSALSLSSLQETEWLLQQLADGAGVAQNVLPGTNLTIVFKPDGRVSGSAGCNEFASNYMLDDPSLTISTAAKTRKNCDQPPGIMLQETQYLSNLSAVNAYQIEGERLQLLNEEGMIILDYTAR